jgi:hypothetical protein
MFRRSTRATAGRPPHRARLGVECLEGREMPATFTVVNTNDGGPGSLRQALLDAYDGFQAPGYPYPGPDVIAFNIPGAGPHVISLESELPSIRGYKDVLDGYTQPGSAPAAGSAPAKLQVVLDGSRFGPGSTGLSLLDDWTVRGLAIREFENGIASGGFGAMRIEGNHIESGSNPFGVGINLSSDSSHGTVGGTTPAARNVISGYGVGVRVAGYYNVVAGNFIGTDPLGVTRRGNGIGVLVQGFGNTIGGTVPGAGNLIAYSSYNGGGIGGTYGAGVNIEPSLPIGTAVLSNRIFANSVGLGIDIKSDGVTANDDDDYFDGPQNFPVLTRAYSGNGFVVEGTLKSRPDTDYLVQFFTSRAADSGTYPDPAGHGEGEFFIGQATVTTDTDGRAEFAAKMKTGASAGWVVTATATRIYYRDNDRANPPVYEDTSEFCKAVPVSGSLSGTVYHDLDADGVRDLFADPGLANRTVFLDLNGNGKIGTGEPTSVSDTAGVYTFVDPPTGSYTVRQVRPGGWFQSAPVPATAGHAVTFTAGQILWGRDFGSYRNGSVSGTVYHDLDADGRRDPGEPGLANRIVYVDGNGNGRRDAGERFDVTDAAGGYTITGLRPGTHTVRVEVPGGWRPSTPAGGAYTLTLASGQFALDRDYGITLA